MNLYEIRFVDNDENEIVNVSQYGNSEKEIENFWKNNLKPNRESKYTFVDAFLLQRNVDFDEDEMKKNAQELFEKIAKQETLT